MMDGALWHGLAMLARSAALGSAAFLMLAANPAIAGLSRRVAVVAASLAMVMALVAMPGTQGQLPWIGFALVVAGAGGVVALGSRGGPDTGILIAAALLLLGGILQAGVHEEFAPLLATLLREAGAALWMGSLPLLWFALRREGGVESARRHGLLVAGGVVLALVGVLIAAPRFETMLTAMPLLVATGVLMVGLLKFTVWQNWLLLGDPPAERLLPMTEVAILLAIALCGPIAALFLGGGGPGLWPVLPAVAIAAALIATAWLPILPGGALALALVGAGTVALAAGAALTGLLAVMGGALRWYAGRRSEPWDGVLAERFWPGIALALLLAVLLLHAV